MSRVMAPCRHAAQLRRAPGSPRRIPAAAADHRRRAAGGQADVSRAQKGDMAAAGAGQPRHALFHRAGSTPSMRDSRSLRRAADSAERRNRLAGHRLSRPDRGSPPGRRPRNCSWAAARPPRRYAGPRRRKAAAGHGQHQGQEAPRPAINPAAIQRCLTAPPRLLPPIISQGRASAGKTRRPPALAILSDQQRVPRPAASRPAPASAQAPAP